MTEKISTSDTVSKFSSCIPNEDPVMETIDCLQQQQFDAPYLAEEKVMALRNPNAQSLRSISRSVNLTCDEFIPKINQLDGDTAQNGSDTIVRNKIEFDSYTARFCNSYCFTLYYYHVLARISYNLVHKQLLR